MFIHKLFSAFATPARVLLAGACAGIAQQSKLMFCRDLVPPAQIGFLEQTYALKLRCRTRIPSTFPQTHTFSIDLNGKPFARGVSNHPYHPAAGEAMVDVTAVSDLSGLIQQCAASKARRPPGCATV